MINVFYSNLSYIACIFPHERPIARRFLEFRGGEKTSGVHSFLMSQKIFLTVCKINFLRDRSLCAYQEGRFLTSILLHLDLSLDDAFSCFLQYSESDCAWASGSKNKQAEIKNHDKPSCLDPFSLKASSAIDFGALAWMFSCEERSCHWNGP